MKKTLGICVALALTAGASPAFAYKLNLESDSSKACAADGTTCEVHCDDGRLAGTMNWNGSVWTDGVKWDASQAVEARKICDANGTSCK